MLRPLWRRRVEQRGGAGGLGRRLFCFLEKIGGDDRRRRGAGRRADLRVSPLLVGKSAVRAAIVALPVPGQRSR